MCRPQEFYEAATAKLRNNKFTYENVIDFYMDKDGSLDYFKIWAGFNISPRWPVEHETWKKVQFIAYQVYRGEVADPSNGALYFNHHSVGGGRGSIRIGSHLFFK